MSKTSSERKSIAKAAKEAKYARQCRLNKLCDSLRKCGYHGTNNDILAWFEDDVRAGVKDTAETLARAKVNAILAKATPKMLRFLRGRQDFQPPHVVLKILSRFQEAA